MDVKFSFGDIAVIAVGLYVFFLFGSALVNSFAGPYHRLA